SSTDAVRLALALIDTEPAFVPSPNISTGISDIDHVDFALVLLTESRDASRSESGHSGSVTGTVFARQRQFRGRFTAASPPRGCSLPRRKTRARQRPSARSLGVPRQPPH